MAPRARWISKRQWHWKPYPLPTPTPDRVLIRDATVWTQAADGILEHTDVLLENGKIAAIGTDLSARDALVIDANGRHVTPGIVDAHSHSATEEMGVNEGVNSVSAEVRIRDILDPRSRQIYQQLAGGVTTIHVLHGSGKLDRRAERHHQVTLGRPGTR